MPLVAETCIETGITGQFGGVSTIGIAIADRHKTGLTKPAIACRLISDKQLTIEARYVGWAFTLLTGISFDVFCILQANAATQRKFIGEKCTAAQLNTIGTL
ncbi:Uncharacterised protein [Vibrio cholerae]|uniref:Uncharacterized protein n=1 Tax=Vibrio cholerae TaxID=666 RepID=A0A656AGT5_VIBCL|nr:Uncharacterised protein [Vibrio cholerae]CSB73861.1 Uncharacterised protein [Vibrio cholerae]CSB90945.1 Uncharacterised protein [Vibrio cholerae]CSC41360.1 Uncharacterised protein [Vibrio cholerae]CSD08337.1 Uncharacterised protein [Vibrio cholerae]